MPTISQLPAAGAIVAADQLPISQAGTARATSVGALLASTQPAIIVSSPSLLGRISLGSGSPEQVNIGAGLSLSAGTLVADGLDHASFPAASSLLATSDIVVSNQGNPMLMQASLLRGLFSAGQNVAIDPNGVISTTITGSSAGTGGTATPIAELQVLTGMAAQDLVAVSHSGSNCAVPYSAFLNGVTIDQAAAAGPANDSDVIWAAQGSNVMVSQTFGAIWSWLTAKLPTYKAPVVEITTNASLDNTAHNGRILVFSRPVTLALTASNMANGFHCNLINLSTGNVTLGTGFVSSSGSLTLLSGQSATVTCASYSGGTVVFAAMPATSSGASAAASNVPGQVSGLTSSAVTSTTLTVSWQMPTAGGSVASYVVQFRPTGTTPWSSSAAITATSYQLTALQPATSYDIVVEAQNASGISAASAILTVSTSATVQSTSPVQVNGLTASSTSSNAVQLSWSSQTGAAAASGYTIQYRITGSSGAVSSISGITSNSISITGLQASTSYDFSVIGVNSVGTGPASAVVTAATMAASAPVTTITWNLAPSGTYTRGSGSIGVNAHVSPSASPIQFGFSLSGSTPPSSWTSAIQVNTDLWGAYVATPATAGTWYAWAEGVDGSAATVASGQFVVQ